MTKGKHFFLRPFLWSMLCCVMTGSGCTSYEVVIDELDQKEANQVLVLLKDKGIDATKEGHAKQKRTTYHVKVKKSDVERALRLLVYNHLPAQNRAGLLQVYPPGSAGIIPTKSDEMARMTMAMQGEIEALLKVVPGVTDARVVVSYDQSSDFTNKTVIKKTASVTLVYLPQQDSDEPPLSDLEIKNLIASSVSGMSSFDVMVVQKMIKPLNYLDATTSLSSLTIPAENQKNSLWYFMAITLMSLAIAAYSILRLYLNRRTPSV